MPVTTVKWQPRPRTAPPVDPFVLRVGDDEAMVYSYSNRAPTSAEIREKQAFGFPMTAWELHVLFVGEAKEILRKTQDKCYWCERKLGKKRVTLDHLVPISLGGKDLIENCVLACRDCNTRRGVMTPEEFRRSKWLRHLRGEIPKPENKHKRKKRKRLTISPSKARRLVRIENRIARLAEIRAAQPTNFQIIYIKSSLFI